MALRAYPPSLGEPARRQRGSPFKAEFPQQKKAAADAIEQGTFRTLATMAKDGRRNGERT
jgi:hypothetical protein